MGISKKELLNDYYMDEIGEIRRQYMEMHNPKQKEGPVEEAFCDELAWS